MLGENLVAGTAGRVVVAVADMEAKIDAAMARADKIEKRQLKADLDDLAKDADES